MPKLEVKPDTPVFSPRLFGEKLREMRKAAGFSSVDKFVRAVEEQTSVHIDRETLLRIERGQLEPNVSKLVAMAHVLASKRFFEQMDEGLVINELLVYSKPLDYLIKSDKFMATMLEAMGLSVDEIADDGKAQKLAAALVALKSDYYETPASEDLHASENVNSYTVTELESF